MVVEFIVKKRTFTERKIIPYECPTWRTTTDHCIFRLV